MLNPTQTIQDLRDAADYLREHPWIKGKDFDDKGGCCAFGAVRAVAMDNTGDCSYQTRDRASQAARAFYRVIGLDIATYNDSDGRTKNQVIEALETTAAAIEKDPKRA